jgi:methylthioribulose-1-phosphate dehydratase
VNHHHQGALHERGAELIAAGRVLYQRGWLPATSGNLSARLDAGRFAMTVSGCDKGAMTEDDVMAVNDRGHALESAQQPSAETLLHVALYQRDPAIGSVLHVHSPNATVLSRVAVGDTVILEGYELLKAFSGIHSHEARLLVPVVDNDQNIPRLERAVAARLDAAEGPVHGYLIRGHGLYAWGEGVTRALHCLEAFDFLFACELRLRELQS